MQPIFIKAIEWELFLPQLALLLLERLFFLAQSLILWNLVYTEDQLRHPDAWTEKLLDSSTFYWWTVIV